MLSLINGTGKRSREKASQKSETIRFRKLRFGEGLSKNAQDFADDPKNAALENRLAPGTMEPTTSLSPLPHVSGARNSREELTSRSLGELETFRRVYFGLTSPVDLAFFKPRFLSASFRDTITLHRRKMFSSRGTLGEGGD